MSRLVLLLLLAAPVAGRETIDLGPVLGAATEAPTEVLGLQHTASGGAGFFFDEPAAVGREALDAWDVAAALERATGLSRESWRVEAGRFLLVPQAHAEPVREALASLAADLLRVVRIEIEVVRPDGSVTRGSLRALDGVRASWHDTATRRFHTDNDVEIACSNSEWGAPSVIVDPIVNTVVEGVSAGLVAMILDDRGAVALDAVVMEGRLDRHATELDLRARYHGRIQLPRYRGAVAAVSGAVEPGEALVARLHGPAGTTVVRLSPTAEGRPGAGTLRWLPDPLAALESAPIDPSRQERWEGTLGRVRETASGARPLFAGAESRSPAEALRAGREEVKARLGERAREKETLGRTVLVELRRVRDREEVARLAIPALAGRVAVARVGRDEAVVQDWDVEVGCWNQIGDPIVGPVFTGDHARLRPRPSPDGRLVALELVYEARGTRIGSPPESGMVVSGAVHPLRSTARTFRGELLLRTGEETRIELGGGEALLVTCRTNVAGEEERR